MTAPIRIQRKRTKGWRMPPNTVYVGRPSRWGNYWSDQGRPVLRARDLYRLWLTVTKLGRAQRNALYAGLPLDQVDFLTQRRADILASLPLLRGKNLACWCPLDRPCHADVLIEIANR